MDPAGSQSRRRHEGRILLAFAVYAPLWLFLLVTGGATCFVASEFSRSFRGMVAGILPVSISLLAIWYSAAKTTRAEKQESESRQFALQVLVNVAILAIVLLFCVAWIYLVFPHIT